MPDTFGLSPEDLAALTDGDLAAFAARDKWLRQAADPRRGGKQLPPNVPWDQLIFRSGRGTFSK